MRRIKNGRDPVTYREDTGGYLVLVSPYSTVAFNPFTAVDAIWHISSINTPSVNIQAL